MFKNFNDLLAIVYLPFILVWTVVMILLVKLVGITTIEAFGLGTATGILLAILKDVFQFYFRKSPPTNGNGTTSGGGSTPPTTPTTPSTPIG